MKKALIGISIAVVIILIGVISVPLLSVSSWKSGTTTELTNMFTAIEKNADATVAYLGNAEPSKADISAEIERVEATKAQVAKTVEEIDDLGPNTLDVTGQYSETEDLHESLIEKLNTLQMNYDEQVTVLKDEQKNGVTVNSATKYAELSDKVAVDYAELEKLIAEL